MRRLDRAIPVVTLAAALAAVTCAFPTDKSNDVSVSIQTDSGRKVVLAGQKLLAHATLWQHAGTDSAEIKNVVFQWATDNDSLAIVKDQGYGGAEVTGIASGNVTLSARAVSFEKSRTDYVPLRVSKPLEIDSVRPSLVRFGDTITVYGVGVDSIFIAFLGTTTQFDFPFPGKIVTRTRDSTGFSTAKFWVTPVAHSTRLSFFGPGVFGDAPDTTYILPFDVLEPNDIAPRAINLEAAPLIASIPALKFFNPALAFEPLKRDEQGVDWYRFSQTTPRDLTIILTAPDVRGTFSTFLSDSLLFVPGSGTTPGQYFIGDSAWTLGPGSHACKGQPFSPAEAQPESTVVALHGMPAGRLHALSIYSQPGRYGLAVFEGYAADPRVGRDAHEEDDFCDAADARGIAVILPAGSLRDTLTIDNAHDIDWIRFRVSSLSTVTLKIAPLTSVTSDPTDVDIYLLTVPGGGASSTLDLLASSTDTGSVESMTSLLSPGDYYFVAVDYLGAPLAYDLCIDTSSCLPFPAARPNPVKKVLGSIRAVAGARRPPLFRPAVRP